MSPPKPGAYGLVKCAGGAPGSSGLLVRLAGDQQSLYLLSAGHVLARLPFNTPHAGAQIDAVSDADGSNPEPIAKLHSCTDFSPSDGTPGDAATALLTINGMSPRVGTIMPAGTAYFVTDGMEAKIYSAVRGTVARGRVTAIKTNGSLDYYQPSGKRVAIPFGKLVECDYLAVGGDSGAPVFNIYNQVIGMHIWGDENKGLSVFLPIRPILEHFQAKLVLDDVAFSMPTGANGENQLKEKSKDTLARTLWGEARGEEKRGIQAVACVVQNRVKIGGWWGNNIHDVCTCPYQFSCWNKDYPNYSRLRSIALSDPDIKVCTNEAAAAISQGIADVTNGATHYHTSNIMPAWAVNHPPCAVIGRHIFYKNID